MAYCEVNFKSKKALKIAVEEGGSRLKCFQPGLGPDLSHFTGKVTLEGPHSPKPHTWYAVAELVDGYIVKVR